MSEYFELVSANRDAVVVEVIKIINNTTLAESFSIRCNLHLDWGICDEMFTSWRGGSTKKFRKLVAAYKKAGNFKMQLCRTDNDATYTRLIYRLSKQNA